ncbi:MAG: DUF6198 family protein [Eubacterium sp.]|nr:DUF6198 family protein [Eubacterium sp.]
MNTTKKLTVYEEAGYLIALVLMGFSVAMVAASNFGLSMIVAPAFELSLKFPFLTFGQAEYVVQGLLLILMYLLIRKVRLIYLASFGTCFVYGLILDLWRFAVPAFNPSVVTPGSQPMPVRIAYYVVGTLLCTISVALFLRVYIYPEVYDLFVKVVSEHFHARFALFKTCFDLSFLALAVILSLTFFGGIRGIGIGTVITAFVNGTLIGFFGKMIDRYCEVKPFFPKAKAVFAGKN